MKTQPPIPDAIRAYPLSWPPHVQRTREPAHSRFAVVTTAGSSYGYKRRVERTLHSAYQELVIELNRIKAKNVIISTNIPVRNDGTPFSDRKPVGGDCGVAVYWSIVTKRNGRTQMDPHSIQCDSWRTVADNIHAITLSLEAMRGVERWGAIKMTVAMAGLRLLAAGDAEVSAVTRRHWREVLEVPFDGWTLEAPLEAVLAFAKAQYKKVTARFHHDTDASEDAKERMVEANQAMENAETELTEAIAERDAGTPA